MKRQYFADTDTLYVEMQAAGVAESRDLDENTVVDVDADGNALAITFEHANARDDIEKILARNFRVDTRAAAAVERIYDKPYSRVANASSAVYAAAEPEAKYGASRADDAAAS